VSLDVHCDFIWACVCLVVVFVNAQDIGRVVEANKLRIASNNMPPAGFEFASFIGALAGRDGLSLGWVRAVSRRGSREPMPFLIHARFVSFIPLGAQR